MFADININNSLSFPLTSRYSPLTPDTISQQPRYPAPPVDKKLAGHEPGQASPLPPSPPPPQISMTMLEVGGAEAGGREISQPMGDCWALGWTGGKAGTYLLFSSEE